MHKLYMVVIVAASVVASLCVAPGVSAMSSGPVISQVQLGDVGMASDEFVVIYNNSDSDVEVTDWCLYYASYGSAGNGNKMVCFTPSSDNMHVFLPAHGSLFVISKEMLVSHTDLDSDFQFSATLSGSGGHIRLLSGVDGVGTEVDKVGWGTATAAEGDSPVEVPPSGEVLKRKVAGVDILQDTDNNRDDFTADVADESYTYGQFYEAPDLCINIDGLQTVIPDGYEVDETGNCTLPPVDVCSNLPGTQASVPDGFEQSGDKCALDLLPLQITEMLPNADGVDDGNEYIEIYNPNDVEVDLMYYLFYIGEGMDSFYAFPAGSIIGPRQYRAFYNGDIGYTLVNTSSQVTLRALDNTSIDETPAYSEPQDGMAWALIDDTWQYTNRPTPGAENKTSYVEITTTTAMTGDLKPCGPNQYRNPETNRCKNIAPVSSTLVPCKVGQYRSEETNRCRNIASDVSQLMPCPEGQERNPATNRCRTVAVLASTTLAPCPEGQERNPATNRCRKVANSMPLASYAPEPVKTEDGNPIIWWSLAGVGVSAVVYGVWEWRQEIANLTKRMSFLGKRAK